MQVYSEKQVRNAKCVQFGKEKDSGKINVTAQACAGREVVIVKETDTIKGDWNKEKDALGTRLQGNKELKPITKM